MSEPTPDQPELSIVIPCLDEAETLGRCVGKARTFLAEHGVAGEVIVADNGSTDGSVELARDLGARVATVATRGYGSAVMGGVQAARGRFVIMGDADDSYDFLALAPFLDQLRAGADLVIGNRFRGGIDPGAMPALHRYLGNPILSGIARLFFHSPCGDFHCGLRGFRREAILALDLRTTGMELASEMVVKATLAGLRIVEAPTVLHRDGRSRRPHLRRWRDGWRHLRFLLLYSPRWLFLYPGVLLMLLGAAGLAWLLPGDRRLGPWTFDARAFLGAATAFVLGSEAAGFAVFAKFYAVSVGLLPKDARFDRMFHYFNLELGLLLGSLLGAAGVAGFVFGTLTGGAAGLRVLIAGMVALTVGVQVALSSFFLSLLGLRHR